MADLHAPITARIDELEQIARAATSHTGRWRWVHGLGEMCDDPTCPFGELFDEAEPGSNFGGTVLMQVHGYDVHEAWQGAEHIATWDPATVLRGLAEDRYLLRKHRRTGPAGGWCGGHGTFLTAWPCDDLLSLARRHGVQP